MSTTEQSTVIGVFRDRAIAEQAIGELKHVGFRDDQIQLLAHNSGGVLGGLRGLFSGQKSTTDDVSNELANAGVAQQDIPFYTRELDAGNFIVLVQQAYGHEQQAHNILHQYGAYNASADVAQMGGTRTIPIREERLDVTKQVVQTGEIRIHKRVITEQKTFTVPVMREEIIIERVPAAGSSTNLENAVQVTNMGSTTERQTVLNRSNTDTDEETTTKLGSSTNSSAANMVNGEEMLTNGGTIRILVREEQVVLNKQPVVVEEIVVRKRQVQENRQISDTVKHEEVHVDSTGNVIVHGEGVEEA